MHVLTVPALLMCAAAAGAVGWTANRLSTGAGGPLLILPWASLAALAAVAVEQLALVTVRSEQGPLWASLVHAGAGLVLVVVGWIVEGFCKLPPDDPDAEEGAEYRRGRQKELPEGEGGYAREIRPRARRRPRGGDAR